MAPIGDDAAEKDGGKKKVPKGKTGLYVTVPRKHQLDGRSRFAKAVKALRNDLLQDLGGSPSTQERLILDRAIYKTIRLSSFEAASMNDQASEKESREYLAMANSLRLDLQSLGLARREAPEEDLKTYISRTYGQPEEDKGKHETGD